MNKKIQLLLYTIFLFLFFATGRKTRAEEAKAYKPSVKTKTDIVAIVDNRNLRRTELVNRVDKFLATLKNDSQPEKTEEAFRRFTENKIVEEWLEIALLAAEAERQGLVVSKDELSQKLEQLHKELGTNKPIDELLHRMGYTMEEYQREIYDAMLGEKLIHDYVKKKYSEKTLRDIYNKNKEEFIRPPEAHVLHIFRAFSGTETKGEKQRVYQEMEELRKRALKGEDFEQLSQQADGLSRGWGGDLGWLSPRNRLPEPINALVFKLNPGKISKVEADKKGYGLHLIKVLEKRRASGMTFEEAQQDVETFVFNQERSRLIEQLKRQHRVIINLNGIPEDIAFPKK